MNRFLISAWSISGEEARGPRAPGGLPVPPGRADPRHPPRLVPHLRGDHVLIRHSGLRPPVSQYLQVNHKFRIKIRVDWEFSVFEYSSFEPCRYQDKYFVDQSCQLNGTYICNIIKVYAIF